MSTPRTYDLIAWGATGFTGKLVAKELCAAVGVGAASRTVCTMGEHPFAGSWWMDA